MNQIKRKTVVSFVGSIEEGGCVGWVGVNYLQNDIFVDLDQLVDYLVEAQRMAMVLAMRLC